MEVKFEKDSSGPSYSYVGIDENIERLSREETDPIDLVNTFVAKSKVSPSSGSVANFSSEKKGQIIAFWGSKLTSKMTNKKFFGYFFSNSKCPYQLDFRGRPFCQEENLDRLTDRCLCWLSEKE